MTYCENPHCENEADRAVAVSVGGYADQARLFCISCENAFSSGVQHGTYRTLERTHSVPDLEAFSESDKARALATRRWKEAQNANE